MAKCDPRDVATDAAGNVYVACEAKGERLCRSDPEILADGGTDLVQAPVPYVSGNEINEDPNNSFEGIHQIGPNSMIAVDKSSNTLNE